MKKFLFYFFLAGLLVLPGCARGPRYTPVAPPSITTTPAVSTGGFYHTVQRGETFYRISKRYEIGVKDLMAANRVTDPGTLEVGQRLFVPRAVFDSSTVRSIVGPKRARYDWKTITLHHSGTLKGNGTRFHRDHLRRGMGGLFYHFVIGNGSYSGDGEIEVGWRWKRQVKANRAHDIQICAVGDFNQQRMTNAQFQSLVYLVALLREDYGISLDDIRRHEDVKGKATECPGAHFPFLKILSKVADIRSR
ncbi:MAG: N-acetylmuramoyl-L-alanine amidase [Candidatus Omnitrophica bacterium]|nr:N-acetylmuramoyl-L-alanine amidase [Candidatus Omnitrophota bacterium]